MADFENLDRINRMYRPDPEDKEIRDIRDDIDLKKELYKSAKELEELNPQVEMMFWDEDVKKILKDLGVTITGNIDTSDEEKLLRLHNRYYAKSLFVDDDAELVDVDPLPRYTFGNNSLKTELYKFGYALGQVGEIGLYYKLLIDINFARGFWRGKFDRAVNDPDMSKDLTSAIVDINEDIKAYDPKVAEKELARVVSDFFLNKEEEQEKVKSK